MIFFVLSSFLVQAQPDSNIVLLSRDSLPKELDKKWLFAFGDDTAYAGPSYNDQQWLFIDDPALTIRPNRERHQRFDSIGWLRLHLYADSSFNNSPLALSISHYGASDIYIDGKLVHSYGIVAKKDNSQYEDPNQLPLIVNLGSPGHHLIAIRYANYEAWKNYRTYHRNKAGLEIFIGDANNLWLDYHMSRIGGASIFLFVFTFFLAFFLLNLFLFIYNSKELANLYFSLFCLAFGAIFLAFYVEKTTHNTFIELTRSHQMVAAVALAGFSLSGFLNTQFGKQSIRFMIITMLAVGTVICLFANNNLGAFLCFCLAGVVSAEAVGLIGRALYRKQKGAAIIGFGILFLTLFILTCFALIFSGNGHLLNDSTELGETLLQIMLLAILSIPVTMSVYLSRTFATINRDLAHQLKQVKTLSAKTLQQEIEKQKLLENRKEELEKEVAQRTSELVIQKKKSDDLLRNILPEEVAEELKETGSTTAKHFDHVSVLFTDFVGFTKAGEKMTPQQLVNELHACFKAFDEIISKYNIEKIKTIGDAYLAVAGLPVSDEQHATNTIRAALEIQAFIAQRKMQLPDHAFNIRIGIHSGSVVAGIVGVKKFAYDIWGDTVNTAARMEQNSESGKVNISQSTFELIKDKFACTYRGQITAKNKGELNMYFVDKEL